MLIAMLVAGLLMVAPQPAAAQASERHSGTVVSVDPVAQSFVLQELVEEGRPRRLVVRVPDGVPVIQSDRIPDEQVTRFDAVFVDRPIDLRDVRPGDFVVVEGPTRGGAATAKRVIVTLRAGSERESVPAAAPGPRSRP